MNLKNLENHAEKKLVIAHQELQKEYKNIRKRKLLELFFLSRCYTVVIQKVHPL